MIITFKKFKNVCKFFRTIRYLGGKEREECYLGAIKCTLKKCPLLRERKK